MNLIILEESERLNENRFFVDSERAMHIRKVLKRGIGDTVDVGIVDGPKGVGIIRSKEKHGFIIECSWDSSFEEQYDSATQNDSSLNGRPIIDLVCALPRPQTLKDVLQAAATMGVRRIHLTNANRVEVCYFSASVMDEKVIRRHLIKGLSQGRQTRLPEVYVHRRFKVFFSQTLPQLEKQELASSDKLFFDVDSREHLIPESISTTKRFVLAIGPEGGWVPFELDFMREYGFRGSVLGPWPLRVENAVVAAISQIETAVYQKTKGIGSANNYFLSE